MSESRKDSDSPARDDKRKGDCYSAGERGWMVRTQQWRGLVLGPFLRGMTRAGMTPDHLTLLSLIAGLAFCPVFFISPAWALGLLVLHVLLDGIDGPLARHQNTASRRGSFTDTMSDQLVVTASTITLMQARLVGEICGGLYIFLYGIVVAFAMIRKSLGIPYSWLVRPRFVVYLGIPVELYLLPKTLEFLMWTFSALLAIKMLTGFIRIRRRL